MPKGQTSRPITRKYKGKGSNAITASKMMEETRKDFAKSPGFRRAANRATNEMRRKKRK